MVIQSPSLFCSLRASITAELLVGLGILVIALIPISFSFHTEQRLARALYYRAVAIEIVDGEAEMLMAGAWRSVSEGAQSYTVIARSATNLPPGRFLLTRDTTQIRLEWIPEQRDQGGGVVREFRISPPSRAQR